MSKTVEYTQATIATLANGTLDDTVLCCPRALSNRGFFIVEAKTGDARLTVEESGWFRSLVRAGVECYVLKPEDEPFLVRRLNGKVESEKP